MPRSSKAPPLPPEPDYNEIIQNDVAKIKRLLGLDVNRLAIGQEIEGIVENSPYGPADFTITGVNTIEFVNVSTSIGPAQGSTGPPNQVTGLTVTPQGGSNTQLNLAWTAAPAADFNYYNVYRAVTSGFVVGPAYKIAQPVTNSYNNTGLSPGTTYYYRVSTTNDAELEGAASSQVSATTTGIAPSLLLHLDNNFLDSSANNVPPYQYPPFASYTPNGFGTPGKFGTHYWKCNTPLETMSFGYHDLFGYDLTTATPLIPDFTTGFSYSLWIYPTDISALDLNRIIIEGRIDNNNQFTIQIDSAGVVYFFVRKAGTSIRQQVTGATVGSWHHIAAVYDAVANTVKIYRNGVSGGASSATTNYPLTDNYWYCGIRGGTTSTSYFEGYIDEIQYFKGYRLSAGEVTNLMNTNSV